MGSIMIEENVVSPAAGAHNRADEKMLQFLIREAGFIPHSATYSTNMYTEST